MKIYVVAVCLLLQILAVANTVSSSSNSSWTVLVGESGTIEIVDESSTAEDSESTSDELKEDVLFYLYTNSGSGEELYLEDDSVLESSSYNSSNPTRIIIHGWQSSSTGKICTTLSEAYLGAGDYNVILVDWSAYTNKNYVYARTKIVTVGKYVGLLIDYLTTQGMSIDDLIVIGHSLGAHVGGVACRNSASTLPILIGLDPAGPLFYVYDTYARMRSTDAEFVQVVHTSAGWLGHKWDLGVSNIWVNGGSKQVGCGMDMFRTCAHSRSYYYCAESISTSATQFVAHYCESYDAYKKGLCSSNNSTTLCGIDIDTSGYGKYFVATSPTSPYAEG